MDSRDLIQTALEAQEYIRELEDHNQNLFDALVAAVRCLDNIDYLVKKQNTGWYASHILLDGIKTELETGAYDTAQKVIAEVNDAT